MDAAWKVRRAIKRAKAEARLNANLVHSAWDGRLFCLHFMIVARGNVWFAHKGDAR